VAQLSFLTYWSSKCKSTITRSITPQGRRSWVFRTHIRVLGFRFQTARKCRCWSSGLTGRYQLSGEKIASVFSPEDGGNMLMRYVGIYLGVHRVSQPRTLISTVPSFGYRTNIFYEWRIAWSKISTLRGIVRFPWNTIIIIIFIICSLYDPCRALASLWGGGVLNLIRPTVGLVWKSNQPVAKASINTGQYST
jgi:hypothetical protein